MQKLPGVHVCMREGVKVTTCMGSKLLIQLSFFSRLLIVPIPAPPVNVAMLVLRIVTVRVHSLGRFAQVIHA